MLQTGARRVCLLLVFGILALRLDAWHADVAAYLDGNLSQQQLNDAQAFFGYDEPLPGLLDHSDPLAEHTLKLLRDQINRWGQSRLPKTIVIRPDAVKNQTIGGRGTRSDPYRGLITAVLAELTDPQVALHLPAGYYEDAGIELPAGAWLIGEPGSVILAPADVSGVETMISLMPGRRASGVVGVTLDGSAVELDLNIGWRHLTGIRIEESHYCVIANNTIRDIPSLGIHGRTGLGNGALIFGNKLERIAFNGIRTSDGWLVVNNYIKHAGIYAHGEGGLGQDGIIIYGSRVRVAHNLILAERNPNGRHGIATQSAADNLVENNVVITKGTVRGAINFSDGSDQNQVRRNLIVGLETQRGHAGNAIRINGERNSVRDNAMFNTARGINTYGWPASSHNIVVGNYISVDGGAILEGPFDQVADNIIASPR